MKNNKHKIINDPVYGFISFKYDIIFQLIDHAWFQRLRRISQLGLSHLVYPGAVHNRFQHAIGAMYLMQNAIQTLKNKGQEITQQEEIGVLIAILLHDIGHGPYSHALEFSLVKGVTHEDISVFMMQRLNEEFEGKLGLAIEIYSDKYPKKFLHQLVSSQLDMDRLDYLLRDSFYSGVTEGQVGSERIIKMLNVKEDQLVVEEKGIYSIEKFLVARRLMYWQVYLHKTVLSAEFMLVNTLKRARDLASQGVELFSSPALNFFLYHSFSKTDFIQDKTVLDNFTRLDDFDIMGAIKVWQNHEDKVLSLLCKKIVNRELFKIQMNKNSFENSFIEDKKQEIQQKFDLSKEESSYFLINEKVANRAYNKDLNSIMIAFKNGEIKDVAEASDHLNLEALSKSVEKWFVCYPVVKL